VSVVGLLRGIVLRRGGDWGSEVAVMGWCLLAVGDVRLLYVRWSLGWRGEVWVFRDGAGMEYMSQGKVQDE